MMIVDAHCHVSPFWYEPVESLLYHMDQNGVDRAVLVQIMGQVNNQYEFDCVRRFPGRFAPVVFVDTRSPAAVHDLARLAAQGARGVRLPATARSLGDDPLAIWRAASQLGLPVDCIGSSIDFASDEFARLVEALPQLPIIIEHLGSDSKPDGELPPYPIRQRVFSLARFPNVYIKIHGLGELCKRAMLGVQPFASGEPALALVDLAWRAFGPQRIMWASDYPLVSAREGYGNALRLVQEYFADKSAWERSCVFGSVAQHIFRLDG